MSVPERIGTVHFLPEESILKFYLALVTAALTLLAGLAPTARAQQQPDPKAVAEIQAFEKSLKLTAAQKTKLATVGKKYAPKLQAIMEKLKKQGGTQPSQELQQKLMKQWATESGPILKAQRKEQEAVFTPAQLSKIKAFQTKMAAKMQGGKG